jgi:hypothetical protein
MRVETVQANGPDTWVVGLVGTQSERFRKVTLTMRDLEKLAILDALHTYDGDGRLLRLGLQAYSLGLAYEFDPYFGLSISRVDPLPHQLEAVYDHLLKLSPRSVSPRRRRRGRKDDHGRPAHPRTRTARPRRAHPDRLPGQPLLPVAARAQGESSTKSSLSSRAATSGISSA